MSGRPKKADTAAAMAGRNTTVGSKKKSDSISSKVEPGDRMKADMTPCQPSTSVHTVIMRVTLSGQATDDLSMESTDAHRRATNVHRRATNVHRAMKGRSRTPNNAPNTLCDKFTGC